METLCVKCQEHPSRVSFGTREQSRNLCLRCYNNGLVEEYGLDFEHADFEPVKLKDARGVERIFEFDTFHFVSGVSLTAFELRDGERRGYEFKVMGAPECDLLELFGRLFQKMQRGLALRHLADGEGGLSIGDTHTARGRITCDLDRDERLPLVVVDGQELSWEQFGSMLMSYEGWQFKLELRDMTDEL